MTPGDNLDVTQPDPTKMEAVGEEQVKQKASHDVSLYRIYAIFAFFIVIMVFIGAKTKSNSASIAQKSNA
jgi:hypothetical protein